jgi:hypothetical protein
MGPRRPMYHHQNPYDRPPATSGGKLSRPGQGESSLHEHRIGLHEGLGGLKPPITKDDHTRALFVSQRGRHEKTPPVFYSTFADTEDGFVIPASGGWVQTVRTPPRLGPKQRHT